MAERDVSDIRAEIEKARDELAGTVDQLADRLAPKHLVDEAKVSIKEKANSPVGKAVIAGSGVLLTLLIIRNLRKSRRDK